MQIVEFCRPPFAHHVVAGRKRLEALSHVKELGSGSIGRVSLFKDEEEGSLFVIKAVPLDSGAWNRKRASMEAHISQLLDPLPHFPTYHAALVHGGCMKLVMEYVAGISLHEVIQQTSNGLEEEVVKQIDQGRGNASKDLVDKGEGHASKDLADKGEGFAPKWVWNPQRPIVLFDFDLCVLLSSGASGGEAVAGRGTGTEEQPWFWGTDDYVAPEVIEQGREGYSPASDWWALGVLVYEALYRCSPFKGPNQEHTFYNIQMRAPQFPESPKVSQHCQTFIRSLLRPRKQYRLGSKAGTCSLEAKHGKQPGGQTACSLEAKLEASLEAKLQPGGQPAAWRPNTVSSLEAKLPAAWRPNWRPACSLEAKLPAAWRPNWRPAWRPNCSLEAKHGKQPGGQTGGQPGGQPAAWMPACSLEAKHDKQPGGQTQ
eukprot:gene30154-35134_t